MKKHIIFSALLLSSLSYTPFVSSMLLFGVDDVVDYMPTPKDLNNYEQSKYKIALTQKNPLLLTENLIATKTNNHNTKLQKNSLMPSHLINDALVNQSFNTENQNDITTLEKTFNSHIKNNYNTLFLELLKACNNFTKETNQPILINDFMAKKIFEHLKNIHENDNQCRRTVITSTDVKACYDNLSSALSKK